MASERRPYDPTLLPKTIDFFAGRARQAPRDAIECALLAGFDLQLLTTSGEPLPMRQADIGCTGHAIEVRINAENPAKGFLPSPGPIRKLRVASGPGVRWDGGYEDGDEIIFRGFCAKQGYPRIGFGECRGRIVGSL